jgi:hypothetical protein
VDMKLSKVVRGVVSALTCCGMLSTQLAQAAGPVSYSPARSGAVANQPASVRDVALAEGGELRGQIVAVQAPLPVVVRRNGEEVARTETDASGRFAVRGLTGGLYEVDTPVGQGMFRAWSPRTAPPAAEQSAVLVAQDKVVRGQWGSSAFGWLGNPWVLAAIVAAAIAIPLALDNDDAS